MLRSPVQSQVGPYEILQPLGAGGMAETFVAVRRGPAGFEQRVCLKLILPGRSADPRFLEQFRDEARLLAQLRYAGIVQVHDFGHADGTHYMALELVDGVDLEKLLTLLKVANAPLPTSIALYIAAEVLAALHYAHSLHVDGEPLGIVHRDISPSNILLSRHGEVKLTDFGIAKFNNRRHRTQSGHVKGKIAYMSPEQVRGDELDARSDLFTVGVVLHEMLTGIHPFEAPTEINLLSNILMGNRKPTRDLMPGAAPELVAVIDALLATDCEHRPQSAIEALRALPLSEPSYVLKRGLEELIAALELPPLRGLRSSSTTFDEDGEELGIASTELRSRTSSTPRRAARRSKLWISMLALVASAGAFWALRAMEPSHAAMPPSLPSVGVTQPSAALERTRGEPRDDKPIAPSRSVTSAPAVDAPTEPTPTVAAGGPSRAAEDTQPITPSDAAVEPAPGSSRSARKLVGRGKHPSRHGDAPGAKPGEAQPATEAGERKGVGRSNTVVSVDDFF